MSEIEFLKKRVDQLDKKTDEFADFYHHVNDKYFDFDSPDNFQSSAQTLNLILHRGEEWQIEMMVNLWRALASVDDKGGCQSGINCYGKDKKMIYFKVYDEPEAIDKLQQSLLNTVRVKGGINETTT